MNRNLIFWDVDTQVDFILPEGKLYVLGAETIIPTLARLTDWAARHKVLVVASTDAHQPDDEEFTQYRPHCLVGTPGQRKIPETTLLPQFTITVSGRDFPMLCDTGRSSSRSKSSMCSPTPTPRLF